MAIMRSYSKPSTKLVDDDSSADTLALIDASPGIVKPDNRGLQQAVPGYEQANYTGGFPPKA